MTPVQAEAILSWAAARPVGPGRPVVTTTEAPQFRRIALQLQRERPAVPGSMAVRGGHSHAAGIRDGNGLLFISHVGDVCPSGFMEVPSGNVREADVLEIYSTAPLFRLLRDVDTFTGRCGACEYRAVCGGSRARAYASTGNPLSEDPLCVYTPRAMKLSRVGRSAGHPAGAHLVTPGTLRGDFDDLTVLNPNPVAAATHHDLHAAAVRSAAAVVDVSSASGPACGPQPRRRAPSRTRPA